MWKWWSRGEATVANFPAQHAEPPPLSKYYWKPGTKWHSTWTQDCLTWNTIAPLQRHEHCESPHCFIVVSVWPDYKTIVLIARHDDEVTELWCMLCYNIWCCCVVELLGASGAQPDNGQTTQQLGPGPHDFATLQLTVCKLCNNFTFSFLCTY